jgi:hypothetical protein
VISLYNGSPSTDRIFAKTYTVDAADTWEKKTLTWVGDTDSDSAFANSSTGALFVQWWFLAGSNFTDGTLTSAWVDFDDGVWADAMVNAFDNTSNNVYLTGVQLEAGTTATEYEHRTFADELATCQRYLYVLRADTDDKGMGLTGQAYSTTVAIVPILFPVTPRAKITGTVVSGADHFALTVAASSRQESTAVAFGSGGLDGIWLSVTVAANLAAGNAVTLWSANADALIVFTGAEL